MIHLSGYLDKFIDSEIGDPRTTSPKIMANTGAAIKSKLQRPRNLTMDGL